MCQALAEEGHKNEIVCLDAPGRPWLRESPCEVHALGPSAGKYCYSNKLLPWLRANRGRFDCAIVHGAWQYQSLGAWLALRHGDIPYFIYPHGGLESWSFDVYPLKRLKKKIYWRLAEHRVLRDARAVFFTSEDERVVASQAFHPFQCNGVIVNEGTAGPAGDPDAQRRAFLERFPDLAGKRLLLFLSRIHPQKGCDLLIEAFARVAASDPALQLVMAGPDQIGWQAELQRRSEALGIGPRVTWTGMLSGNLKWGAFLAVEAYCLPSHCDSFGIAVVEALACGLVVLISNKVGIWREIQADGAGIASNNDLAGVTDCLRWWLTLSPEQRRAMGQRARDCFANRFHIGPAARGLIQTLRSHGIDA
ncbi:MAG: glycosyltransferase [Planctomycetaceae bacterium]|nr:glycosyltransferase [Planctomycetaceae bacterium]